MFTLDKVTRTLQALIGGAPTTTNPTFLCTYEQSPPTAGFTTTPGSLNGATAVNLTPVPATGCTITVKELAIQNVDTVAQNVTVQMLDSSGPTTSRLVGPYTLQTGETLCYTPDQGWYCMDVNGNRKTNQPASSGASSTALSAGVSAGTAASQASSEAASAGTAASQASSEAASAGTAASTTSSAASSTASSTTTTESQNSSQAASAGTAASTASSEAASAGTAASTASSVASFANAAASTASSTQSLQLSAGQSVTVSKTKSSFGF
jgi:hypothetical protein